MPDAATEDPGPLPMHGIRREVVEELIRNRGGAIVHVENDDRWEEWVGYRCFVKKV